jgi:outer membrane lipoprotein-sorting protein
VKSGYSCGHGLSKKDGSMKIIVLLAAAAVAWPVWAQAPVEAQKQADAEKTAATPAKSAKAQKVHKATAAKRQQDARHCLQQPNNDAIIRCAEEYL